MQKNYKCSADGKVMLKHCWRGMPSCWENCKDAIQWKDMDMAWPNNGARKPLKLTFNLLCLLVSDLNPFSGTCPTKNCIHNLSQGFFPFQSHKHPHTPATLLINVTPAFCPLTDKRNKRRKPRKRDGIVQVKPSTKRTGRIRTGVAWSAQNVVPLLCG